MSRARALPMLTAMAREADREKNLWSASMNALVTMGKVFPWTACQHNKKRMYEVSFVWPIRIFENLSQPYRTLQDIHGFRGSVMRCCEAMPLLSVKNTFVFWISVMNRLATEV